MIFKAVRSVFPFTSCCIFQELGLYKYYRGQFQDYFCCKKEKSQLNFQIGICFLGCLRICLWTIIIFGVEICIVSLPLQSFCC